MSNTLPTPVKQRMAASGGPAPVSLFEVLTLSMAAYFWSDALVTTSSVLVTAGIPDPGGGPGPHPEAAPVGGESVYPLYEPPSSGAGPAIATFVPWIIKAPVITQCKSTQASTFRLSIQNLSGNTVQRDASQIFSEHEFYGALIYLRLWRLDCESSLLDFQGNITKVTLNADGDSMDLSGEGSFNWAKVTAPTVQIGATCGNSYNAVGAFSECGAFAGSTPCTNSYGTCQQLTRFKGVVTEWSGQQVDYSQYAQPIPLRPYNPIGKV
jgi:hypothetical protein